MIRVFICGEGKHDVGVPDEERSTVRNDGWLQVVLRRLIGEDVQFRAVKRAGLVLQRREQRKYRPLPPGHGMKAMVSKLQARQEGYDLVVFMVDADSTDRKVWHSRRGEILEGFNRIVGVVDVCCVPMSTSESWLLADSKAWAAVGLADLKVLPKRPERIWGKRKDPSSGHPHQYFRRVCLRAGVRNSLEVRLQIAELCDVSTLKEACPISFVGFVCDLEVARRKLE